jgi:hypothetical protein
MNTAPLSQYTNSYVEETSPASGSRRKPRVKSEKRSQSMTIWWAERKARKREQDEKNGTPLKTESRPGSSNGRRGGRASTGSAAAAALSAAPSEPARRASLHYPDHPHHYPPPEAYPTHHGPPPLTAPSPMYLFASAPPPPPPHSMLQYSPLAALPSGAYQFSGPPPLGINSLNRILVRMDRRVHLGRGQRAVGSLFATDLLRSHLHHRRILARMRPCRWGENGRFRSWYRVRRRAKREGEVVRCQFLEMKRIRSILTRCTTLHAGFSACY